MNIILGSHIDLVVDVQQLNVQGTEGCELKHKNHGSEFTQLHHKDELKDMCLYSANRKLTTDYTSGDIDLYWQGGVLSWTVVTPV